MTRQRPTCVKPSSVRTAGHTLRGQGFAGRALLAHHLRGLERRPGDCVLRPDLKALRLRLRLRRCRQTVRQEFCFAKY